MWLAMTIAVDLRRKATKQTTNKQNLSSLMLQNKGRSRSGVVDKPHPYKPGVAGSIPRFTCLSDETSSCGPVSI